MGDYDRFNSVILGRNPYYSKQIEICRSLQKYRITAVKAANGVGKTFVAAGVLLAFSILSPGSKVIAAAPTEGQLRNVLWSEVAAAHASAADNGMPLGGRLKSLTYELGDNWRVEGYGSGSVESKSGRHSEDLLAVLDEASGTQPSVNEAVDSLNPSKYLYIGNPLIPEGKFYEVCEHSAGNPQINVITITAFDSPYIDKPRSEAKFGMADATWLEGVRYEYGEQSLWWPPHVLAQFPGHSEDSLIEPAWLDLCVKMIHRREGERWIGVDIAEVNGGGDLSVVLCRDDSGVLDIDASNAWDLGELATRVALMMTRHGVKPSRVVFDAVGTGNDFGFRLEAKSIHGAQAYKGSWSGGHNFENLRSATGWMVRRRLNPEITLSERNPYTGSDLVLPQKPLAISPAHMALLRPELLAIHYCNTPKGKIALEPKEKTTELLKHSPNFADALFMTYAFPNV